MTLTLTGRDTGLLGKSSELSWAPSTLYTALYTVYTGESLNTVHLDTAHCSHTHQSTATEP